MTRSGDFLGDFLYRWPSFEHRLTPVRSSEDRVPNSLSPAPPRFTLVDAMLSRPDLEDGTSLQHTAFVMGTLRHVFF